MVSRQALKEMRYLWTRAARFTSVCVDVEPHNYSYDSTRDDENGEAHAEFNDKLCEQERIGIRSQNIVTTS